MQTKSASTARDSAFVLVRSCPHKGDLADLIGEERTSAGGEDEVYELKEKHVYYRNHSYQ